MHQLGFPCPQPSDPNLDSCPFLRTHPTQSILKKVGDGCAYPELHKARDICRPPQGASQELSIFSPSLSAQASPERGIF